MNEDVFKYLNKCMFYTIKVEKPYNRTTLKIREDKGDKLYSAVSDTRLITTNMRLEMCYNKIKEQIDNE